MCVKSHLAVVNREARPNQVSFGGLVRGESAMKTEEEIGSLVNFTFRVSCSQLRPWTSAVHQSSVHNITAAWCFIPQINNLWKSPAKASLHIHWPKWNKDGKWLLYLVRISSAGPQEILCSPLSEVDSLKLTQVTFFYSFQPTKVSNTTWLLSVSGESNWLFITGYQGSTGSRSKREIGERKSVGKASLLSGKNKKLVGFLWI